MLLPSAANPSLVVLDVSRNPITASGVAALADLNALCWLRMNSTQIGDVGIEQLSKLPSLRRLYILESGATDEAVERFRSANPACVVHG